MTKLLCPQKYYYPDKRWSSRRLIVATLTFWIENTKIRYSNQPSWRDVCSYFVTSFLAGFWQRMWVGTSQIVRHYGIESTLRFISVTSMIEFILLRSLWELEVNIAFILAYEVRVLWNILTSVLHSVFIKRFFFIQNLLLPELRSR